MTEAAVIALLLFRRFWRVFPVFLAYSVWTLAASAAFYLAVRAYPDSYITASLVFTVVDSALLFGVLVELGVSILRPLRGSLPRFTPLAVALLILALGAAIWPFVAFPGAVHLSLEEAVLTRIQQDFRVLRVVVFVLLAAFSQVLSIGWRDRELQIATGLGFNSLVGLAVAMVHTHEATAAQYNQLNRLVIASYLCSLIYWAVSFAQPEAERRKFTPQMQNVLLAVAGSAHATRIALSDSSIENAQGNRTIEGDRRSS